MTLLIALMVVAMLLCDILGTLVTAFIAHGRPWLAGAFDGTRDIFTMLSIGGGAVTVWANGVSATTALIFGGLFVASLVGTVLGMKADHVIERRFPKP